jgi:hypothetical protein
MNPGLIPPPDVAAAAKRGLELREKFHRGGTSVGAHRARQLSERRPLSLRTIVAMSLFRSPRGRQGVQKSRMGRRNQPLRRLYRLAALGRRGWPPLGGQPEVAPKSSGRGVTAHRTQLPEQRASRWTRGRDDRLADCAEPLTLLSLTSDRSCRGDW